MKTRLLLIAVIFSASLISGCSNAPTVKLGETDSGRTVKLVRGQDLVVKLPSNPTTGYGWVVVKHDGLLQVEKPSYKSDPAPSGMVGVGGAETFRFSASDAGASELRLEYRRAWERDKRAERSWSVKLEVE